ncbi:MAG: type II toxin-antitoxin system HicB family antitoxin [Ignavibacteriae bacterium]|nr:type II toxin-antitoxin system HicB family antitoxin [Ignavibacteriota bacterium]
MKKVSFAEFVKEVLKNARYKEGVNEKCIIGIAPDLPGCMTQADNFEDARANLIDAIELWVTSALKDGDPIPAVNGRSLITAVNRLSKSRKNFVHA